MANEAKTPEGGRARRFWSRIPPTFGALALILAGGAALRLFRLETAPPGLYCDEVAIGANAHSLGRTGRDLNGVRMPLYVEERSFEQLGGSQVVYQPVYTYAAVPWVTILGRTPFAVRLTSVCFGLAAILGTYFLGRRLLGRTEGLLAAALLALMPGHVHFSRVAFEAISLPAILIFGVWLLVEGLRRPGRLCGGVALLAVATYAYPVAKLFVPLFLAAFGILHRKSLWECRRATAWALAVGGVLLIPNVCLVVFGEQQERVHQLLLTSADLSEERATEFLRVRADHGWARAVLSTPLLRVPFTFAYNYLGYFGPEYLFFRGDSNLRHNTLFGGPYYRTLIPFAIAGIAVAIQRRREPEIRLLLLWLLLYPVPASLTIQSPHAIRSITAFPVFELLCSLGAVSLVAYGARLKGAAARAYWPHYAAALASLIGIVGVPLEAAAYLRHYHGQYPVDSASAWQAGVGEAIRGAEALRSKDDVVCLSRRLINPFLDAVFFAGLPAGSLPFSEDLNERLRPHRYRIAGPAETPAADPGELWIITADEIRAHPRLFVWRDFPYSDGTPNLFLVSSGKRP